MPAKFPTASHPESVHVQLDMTGQGKQPGPVSQWNLKCRGRPDDQRLPVVNEVCKEGGPLMGDIAGLTATQKFLKAHRHGFAANCEEHLASAT